MTNATSSHQFRLLTPAAAQEALELFGVTWAPRLERTGEPVNGRGLYAWVKEPADGGSAEHGGVLYWGRGKNVDKRLAEERSWTDDDYVHAHGVAARRNGAVAVRDAVNPNAASGKLIAARSVIASTGLDKGIYENAVRAFRHDVEANPEAAAERFVVRLSIHVGDIGAPINSQYASAWRIRMFSEAEKNRVYSADRAAYLAAVHLFPESK